MQSCFFQEVEALFTEEQKTLSQTVTVEQPTSFLTEQEIGDLRQVLNRR